MGLYDRDYARGNDTFAYESAHRSEAQIVSFVKETYKLFAASMMAGAVGAYVAIPFAAQIAAMGWLFYIPVLLFGMFVLPMVQNKPGINLVALFGFTAATGVMATPLISYTLGFANGAALIGNAFLTTAVLFGALSYFAIKTTKDFTSYGKVLFWAFIIMFASALINQFFFGSGIVMIVIQSIFLLIISFMVVVDTQNLINGAYSTPIEAALALYIDFYNMFVTLLQLFGIFNGDD